MGPSGCGKSHIGQLLATAINAVFIDADELHPACNINKMSAERPLSDADREPWLQRVGSEMTATDGSIVVACSALKRTYRNIIRETAPNTAFIHLQLSPEVLKSRMSSRADHFMPTSLLKSQLAILEPLAPDERGSTIDVSTLPAQIVATISSWIESWDSR